MAFCAVADSVRSVAGELPRTAAAPRQQLLLLLRVVNYIFQMLLPCPTEKPCTYVAYKRGRGRGSGAGEGGGGVMLHGATASVLIWNTCCSSLARSAAATVAAFRICPAATSNSLGMCTQRSLFSFALASVSPSPLLFFRSLLLLLFVYLLRLLLPLLLLLPLRLCCCSLYGLLLIRVLIVVAT